jgi:hypothetical protein
LASKGKNQCKLGFHFSASKVGDIYSWIKRIWVENNILDKIQNLNIYVG